MEQEGKGYDEKETDPITSQVPQWSFEITGLQKQIKNFTKLYELVRAYLLETYDLGINISWIMSSVMMIINQILIKSIKMCNCNRDIRG